MIVTEAKTGRSYAWIAILLVLGAGFLAFLPSTLDRFIADDFLILKSSLDVGLARVWVSDFARGETAGELYRPLVNASFLTDHALWGLSAFGYHLTNDLLHVITTGLLFVLALRLTRSCGIAFMGAAFFALQPAHAPSVNWVSGRTDLLAGMCYGLSLVGEVLWLEAPARRVRHTWMGVALVGLGGALLSKETGLVVPAVWVALAAVFVLQRRSFRSRREFLAATVLAAGVIALYFILRHAALGTFLGGSSRVTTDPFHLLKNGVYYVAFFFAPVPTLTESAAVLGLALFAALAIGLLAVRAVRRGALTSGEVVVLVVITAGPLLMVSTVRASWLEYVPSFGLSLATAVVLAKNASDIPASLANWARFLGVAALIVYFAVLALPWRQDYRDNGQLSAATIESHRGISADAYVLNVPINSNRTPLWSVGLPQAVELLSDQRSALIPVNFVRDVSDLGEGVAPKVAICGNLALVQPGMGGTLTLYDRSAIHFAFPADSTLPKTTLVQAVIMADSGPILAIRRDTASPTAFLAFNEAAELVPVQADPSLCDGRDTLFARAIAGRVLKRD